MINRTAVSRAIRNITDGPRAPAGRAARPVRIRDEGELLDTVEARAGGGPPAVGQRVRLETGPQGDAALHLARTADVVYLPKMGAVVDAAGAIHRSTANEVAQYDPLFTSFPYFRRKGDDLVFSPPDRMPRFGPSTVWLPFHATYNYGHFLLDALPSLLAASEAEALGAMPPVAPPLKPWQEELLALAFGPELGLVQTKAHAVRLEEALYASSMDNFLHAPTQAVARLREQILRRTPRGAERGPRRLYFSRRGWSMRVMLNEAEVEAALRERGFTVVHPEDFSVREQINLVRDAEIVVAPTGAGLANALFAPVEARVIEIQPVGFGGGWVRAFRALLGGHCFVLEVPSAVPVREVPIRHRLRLGFRFAYVLPLEALIEQVEA